MSVEKLVLDKEPIPYTIHANVVLQNITDGLALGIWCYISSLPSGWSFNKQHLMKHFNIGIKKLNKCLAILATHNAIIFEQSRDELGHYAAKTLKVLNGATFKDIHNKTIKESTTSHREAKTVITATVTTVKNDYKENKSYKENKKLYKAPQKRATKITSSFTPNESNKLLAQRLGFNIVEQTTKFINHYTATNRYMADWDALFNNWLLTARSYVKSRSESTTMASSGISKPNELRSTVRFYEKSEEKELSSPEIIEQNMTSLYQLMGITRRNQPYVDAIR